MAWQNHLYIFLSDADWNQQTSTGTFNYNIERSCEVATSISLVTRNLNVFPASYDKANKRLYRESFRLEGYYNVNENVLQWVQTSQ